VDLWQQALEELGVDGDFYTARVRDEQEVLPWDPIDCGVSREFLLRERRRAYEAARTGDCRGGKCLRCGVRGCH